MIVVVSLEVRCRKCGVMGEARGSGALQFDMIREVIDAPPMLNAVAEARDILQSEDGWDLAEELCPTCSDGD